MPSQKLVQGQDRRLVSKDDAWSITVAGCPTAFRVAKVYDDLERAGVISIGPDFRRMMLAMAPERISQFGAEISAVPIVDDTHSRALARSLTCPYELDLSHLGRAFGEGGLAERIPDNTDVIFFAYGAVGVMRRDPIAESIMLDAWEISGSNDGITPWRADTIVLRFGTFA